MQTTSAALFRLIHHTPLPLDGQRAQQLLRALSDSFQRHLDRHHPTGAVLNVNQTIREASPQLPDSTQPPLPSSFVETQKHYDSLINHPTFIANRSPGRSSSFTANGVPLSIFHMFENRLARGTLDVVLVSRCITGLGGFPMSPAERKKSAFASRITRLLQTTNQVPLSKLLSHRPVSSSWINQMFLEGREADIWNLLRQGLVSNGLFPAFIGAGLHHRGINFALGMLIKATDDEIMRGIIMPRLLSTIFKLSSSILSHPSQAIKGDTAVYDGIIAKLEGSNWTAAQDSKSFLLAVLGLCHPTSPTPDAAVDFVKFLTNPANTPLTHIRISDPRFFEPMLWLCIRTSTLLIDQGSYESARTILDIAKETYQDKLRATDEEPHPKHRNKIETAIEPESALLLDKLNEMLPA
jgi:hypothetical protein